MQLYQYKQFQYIIESAASPKKQQQTPSFKIFAQHYVGHNKIHSWTSALSQFDRHDFIFRLVAIVNEFLMNFYIKSYAYWVVIGVGVRRKNGSLWTFIRFWLSLQCIRCIVVIPFLEYRTTIPLIIRGHQESVWVCESVDGAFLSIFLLFYFFKFQCEWFVSRYLFCSQFYKKLIVIARLTTVPITTEQTIWIRAFCFFLQK